MPARKRPMRYAHSEGHTDVCYSEDGKHILTCGIDGDVRLWAGLEDDDPTSQCVGEQAITVVQKGKHFYVGTDDNSVQAYTFPGAERDGLISRFTAAVTHLAVSKDGKKVVAGASDMEIHICEIGTPNTVVLTGHTAPILSVALDPKDKYVASSSCDGTVCVWSIEQEKPVKTWNCVPTCSSFFLAKCLARPSWHPETGRYLAVPHGKDVRLYERATWDKVLNFSDEQLNQDFSITAFSPCGAYLAASTCGGEIRVWNVNLQTCIVQTKHDRGTNICALAWNPSNNGEIAYCDTSGQLGTVEDCISTSEPDISSAPSPAKSIEQESEMMTVDEMITSNQLDEDDDEDNENVISLEKIKSQVMKPNHEDDLLSKALSIDDNDIDDTESKISEKIISPEIDLQPPFQPSSTPVHLQQRFMVWNSVGVVRCYNTEEENSIDVEFHDTSLHHAIHINNFLKHTVAALSEEALVLACEAQEDVCSKVVCVLLNAWDGTKEWGVDLPEGEEALAVAAASSWVAVATDTRSLRFFTLGGTQREVLSLPGPVVCLTGQRNRLMAIFHYGLGLPGDQNLGYVVISVTSKLQAITPFQPLPLSPKSTLKWAGFSDEGTPFILDSAGLLRMLSKKGYWLPACDTKSHCKGKSDHYFVIGVSENYQNIRCILCKGAYYPPTTPRPNVVEISFQLPLCEPATEKSILEEKFWRSQLACQAIDDFSKIGDATFMDKDAIEKVIKESVIKLFALACRSELDFRAVELCGLMPSPQVVQLAMKYASKLGKIHLADKVADVAAQKLKEGEETALCDPLTPRYNWEQPSLQLTSYRDEPRSEDIVVVSTASINGHEAPVPEMPSETENLLLAAQKKKEKKLEIRPISFVSPKCPNPFKKTVTKSENTRGLEGLTASFVQMTNKNNKPPPAPEKPSPPQSKVKQTVLSASNKQADGTTAPAKKGPTFVAWYAKEKSALLEEFPELSATELTRQAMKRFKEMLTKEQKLAAAAAQSVSTNNEQQTRLESSQNSENTQNSQDSEIQLVSDSSAKQEKKRMNESSEESQQPAKKMASSTSKLMAFTFKK